MDKQTIESRTADTILQRPKDIKLPWGTVQAPRPTLATLIMVSEEISRLPEFDDEGGRVVASLRWGRNSEGIARIVAILLLGAKECVKTELRRSFPMFWRRRQVKVDKVAPLAKMVLQQMTPAEMNTLLAEMLADLQLGDFFAITTFLSGINLTRRTKVEGQTQSGRQ